MKNFIVVLFGIILWLSYSEIEFDESSSSPEEHKEILCLAYNSYYEANNQGIEGMKRVNEVVLNRVYSSGYPSTVCDVVKHKTGLTWQFSWLMDLTKRNNMRYDIRPEGFDTALNVAYQSYYGNYKKHLTDDVLYYKVCSTKHRFFDKLKFVEKHKLHCFYKESKKMSKWKSQDFSKENNLDAFENWHQGYVQAQKEIIEKLKQNKQQKIETFLKNNKEIFYV